MSEREQSSRNFPRPTLRPEALPLAWDQLTKTQKQAFGDIVGWLAAAVADLPREERDGRQPQAGSVANGIGRRMSGVGLLSGERGTGKTSLLLSLTGATRPRHGNRIESRSDLASDMLSSVVSSLEAVCGRVVWLESLDMDTLPRTANLLAAILARVDDALDGRRAWRRAERRGPGGLLDDTTEREHVLTRFERLRADIALAWRGALSATLDPDQYAVEVSRTEQARLKLGERFGQILTAFARFGFEGSDIENPLFVLPVDDIDFDPIHCLELLQLLRLIATPRLFTLVLGDETSIEVISRLSLAGDYARITRGAGRERFATLRPEAVAAIIAGTGSSAVRKLLPPAQRVLLQAMTIPDALRYVPTAGQPTLHDLLTACPGPRSDLNFPMRGNGTLADLFLLTKGEEKLLHWGAYWGAQVLAAPARQVVDLWHLLDRLPPCRDTKDVRGIDPAGRGNGSSDTGASNPDEPVIDVFIEALRALMEEEHDLYLDQRNSILSGFQQDATGRPYFDTDVIMLNREMQVQQSLEAGTCTVRVRQKARWRLGPWGSTTGDAPDLEPPAHRPLLQDRTAAAVMVVHDMLALGASGNVVGHPLATVANERGWISAEWPVGVDRVSAPWPEPEWITFREFDLFGKLWGDVCQKIQNDCSTLSEPDRAAITAQGFLTCMLDAVEDKWHGQRDASRAFGERAWSPLTSRLANLLGPPRATSARPVLRTLPITVACILAPEAALFLPKKTVSMFASVLEPRWSQPWCKRAIRSARTERAKAFYAAGGGDLAERLLAPKTFQRRLRAAIERTARLHAQMQQERGMVPTPAPTIPRDDPKSWAPVIESLLSSLDKFPVQRKSRSVRKPSAGPSEWERELPEMATFLQDALEGLRGEFLASLDHPINTACRGDLCPRPQELQRAAAGSAPPSPR